MSQTFDRDPGGTFKRAVSCLEYGQSVARQPDFRSVADRAISDPLLLRRCVELKEK